MKTNCRKKILFLLIISAMSIFISSNVSAQTPQNYMRIAKIVVDSAQLDNYKIALKEQMKAALELEEGVLAYSALQDKNNATHITIIETYASVEAYQKHIVAEHFKKYKKAVENMVLSLELQEVVPIAIGDKKQITIY